MIAIGLFDRGPSLSSNDDWVYQWSVRQLVAGHGLRFHPDQSALALVQTFWGWAAAMGTPSFSTLRLSALPFVGLAAGAVFLMARSLGASRPFAVLAAAALLTNPLYAAVATSFMTEPFYVGLLLAAAAAAVRWLEHDASRPACVVLVFLAAAERQHGVLIAVALTAMLAVRHLRGRRLRRIDAAWTAGLWGVCAVSQAIVPVLHLNTTAERENIIALVAANPRAVLLPLLFLPIMLGLALGAFALALATAPAEDRASRRPLWLFAFGLIGLGWSVGRWFIEGTGFPGNYVTPQGLGPITLGGVKPSVYPAVATAALTVIAIAAAVTTFVSRPQRWLPARLGLGEQFLVLLAAVQLLPIVATPVYDRYFLPLACLLPVAARLATASRHPNRSMAFGLACCLGGLLVYVVGEQDYQAWQAARDAAMRQFLVTHSAAEIHAGYEANAEYWEIPEYDLFGIARLGGRPGDLTPALDGPPGATFKLAVVGSNDPRPGVAYWSLAPGKVIVEPKAPS